jgi:membrane dipeptidase
MNARAEYKDHAIDPSAWAKSLGISKEAIEIYMANEVIDLHIDSFIWTRVFGYDLTERHGKGLLGARFFSQADIPRLREAKVTGGIWSITTNPLRPMGDRTDTFEKNLLELKAIFASVPHEIALCRTASDFETARKKGLHGAFIGIQGGNALDRDLDALELAAKDVIRITLVHLSTSTLGTTSSPLKVKKDGALTSYGKDYVRRLNDKRIFVDLAHINRQGFFDAASVHDKSQPLIVTHTGVAGVHPHWRNLDDEQLKVIADTGGTIGVIYQASFLGKSWLFGRAEWIVQHLEHIVKTVGEDYASLGSDWDGMIIPPRDLPTCLELPRLVQMMLDRKWSPERISKILGGNFLRSLRLLRP